MIDFENKADAKVLKGLSQVEQQLLYRLIQESKPIAKKRVPILVP